MTVPALLAELRTRDIWVWVEGDRLRCSAPAGMLTPQVRDQLRRHKHDVVEFLRSAEALAQPLRAIVPLQPRGTRTPIFGVAGHNGDVFCYRALAQQLGDDQPFYGLQPPGLDGEREPFTRVEDLAAYFAAQVRAFRPAGPCIIAGFCAGGMIAFELGRQLLASGAAVGSIALFGAPYPTSYRMLPHLRRQWGTRFQRVIAQTRALAALWSHERRLYVAGKLRARAARRAAQPPPPDPALVLRARVESATLAAGRRYTPGHFAGRVTLFLPCEGWVRSGLEPLRWRSVARQAEEYYGPEGCSGDNMLLEPYAPVFAELFRRCRSTVG